MSSRSQIFSSDGFGEVVIFSLSCCHTSPVTLLLSDINFSVTSGCFSHFCAITSFKAIWGRAAVLKVSDFKGF